MNELGHWPAPILTVCVVTYNHQDYIADCLLSIIGQKTSFDFEIIVGVDNSIDKTREIVLAFSKEFPHLIKPIFQSENIGGTKNYLVTHNLSQSKYIVHIDGDDLMLPGKLQMQVDFLENNEEFSAVWHRVNFFNDSGYVFSGQNCDITVFQNGVLNLDQSMRLGSVTANCSLMYRRKCRITTTSDQILLDLYFTWELLTAGKGKILSDVLGCYRVSSKNSASKILNVREIAVQHVAYYYKKFPLQRSNLVVFLIIHFLTDIRKFRKSSLLLFLAILRFKALFNPLNLMKAILEAYKLNKFVLDRKYKLLYKK